MRLRVAQGRKVVHEGKAYRDGETFTAESSPEIQSWLQAGFIEEVQVKSKKKSAAQRKASKGSRSMS